MEERPVLPVSTCTCQGELDAERPHHELTVELEPAQASASTRKSAAEDDETAFAPEAVPAAKLMEEPADEPAAREPAGDTDGDPHE